MIIYPVSCSTDLRTSPGRCQGPVPSNTREFNSYLLRQHVCLFKRQQECYLWPLHILPIAPGFGDTGLICYQARHTSLCCFSYKARLCLPSTGPERALCISIYWHHFLQNGIDLREIHHHGSVERTFPKEIHFRDVLHSLLRSGGSVQPWPLSYRVFRNYTPS